MPLETVGRGRARIGKKNGYAIEYVDLVTPFENTTLETEQNMSDSSAIYFCKAYLETCNYDSVSIWVKVYRKFEGKEIFLDSSKWLGAADTVYFEWKY